jgi:anthranilate phosphoribosyltransferase
MSTTAPTRVWTVANGAVGEERVDAVRLGLPRAELSDLRGGDAHQNAAVVRQVLAGHIGPVRDAVLLNAAAALVACEPSADRSLADQLTAGLEQATTSIDSGAAGEVLERWVKASRD